MKQYNARIRSKTDTTANWASNITFIPLKGEIIIYSDFAQKEIDGNMINVPNFKIGDGTTFAVDLPFVNDDLRDQLTAHMMNTSIHITDAEREFWNNKVRCYMDAEEDEDGYMVENEELVFTTL